MSLVRAGFVEIPPCGFASDRLEHLEAVETERGAHTTGSDPDSLPVRLRPQEQRSRGLQGTQLSLDALGAPFLVAGALKSVYDVGLCVLFRNVPLPDDRRVV